MNLRSGSSRTRGYIVLDLAGVHVELDVLWKDVEDLHDRPFPSILII